MIEGVLSVLEGQAPKVIEQKLLMYLPANERAKVAEQEGEANNGEKKEEDNQKILINSSSSRDFSLAYLFLKLFQEIPILNLFFNLATLFLVSLINFCSTSR